MAVTPLRMLLFLGGATTAAVGTAYFTGALDGLFGRNLAAPPIEAAAPAAPATPATETARTEAPKPETPPTQQQAAISPAPEAAPKPSEQPSAPQEEPLPPSFDVLRVEPDGSIVIAGQASPDAEVEILSGSKVLGKVKATATGDFVAALDQPLKPGDYQIVLRSKTATNVVANSKETAVVSIPETKDGQVLALVEQPGSPSRLITKPEAPAAPAPAVAEPAPQPAEPSAQEPAAQSQTATAQPTTPKVGRPAPAANVAVDAVEIEGRKIFVAGSSDPGKTVRIYANDILLGDAKTSPEGRFLIEAERDLPVGDYVVRADVLGPDGAKVIARAAVPFSREPGENISAVAPQQPASTTESQVPAPSSPDPASAASAQPSTAEAQPSTDAANAQPSQQAAATGEGSALAPKLEAVDGSVIIRRGDSLWRISKRVYGRGVRYSTIYLANQEQIKNPDLIWPGQIFLVPETTKEGEKADMKAIEEPAPSTVQ